MANPPLATNVVLLCHFDGNHGDTTSIDSSLLANSLGFVGTVVPSITTAQAKFGVSSLDTSVAAGSGRISVADNAGWDFGSGQFTVEAWVRFTTLPSTSN